MITADELARLIALEDDTFEGLPTSEVRCVACGADLDDWADAPAASRDKTAR